MKGGTPLKNTNTEFIKHKNAEMILINQNRKNNH